VLTQESEQYDLNKGDEALLPEYRVELTNYKNIQDRQNIYTSFSIVLTKLGDNPGSEVVAELKDGVFFDPRSDYGVITLYDFNYEYEENDDWRGMEFWGASVNLDIDPISGLPENLHLTPYFENGDYKGVTLSFSWKDFGDTSSFFRYSTTLP
jgi:hypothetical protein